MLEGGLITLQGPSSTSARKAASLLTTAAGGSEAEDDPVLPKVLQVAGRAQATSVKTDGGTRRINLR